MRAATISPMAAASATSARRRSFKVL
jgi:hypothetical protein